MATNFPASLDSLTNPTASDKLNSVTVPHATQHSTLNDAVEALEAKVGVDGSAVTTSHDYLIDKQSVVPYADAAARTTAVPSPVEGQMSYLEDTNSVEVYDGSAWTAVGGGGKILQVVTTFVAGGFSTSSLTFVDVTGHSVTITPSSASSKILVLYDAYIFHATAGGTREINLVRDSTTINQPSSGTLPASAQTYLGASENGPTGFHHLDSPATTSAVTYKIQVKTDRGTVYVGRDAGNVLNTPSNLTVMEVSA